MQITKQINELTIEKWRFSYVDGHIILDSYKIEVRENSRKKNFQVSRIYDRHMERKSNMLEKDVPLSEEIKAEAKERFFRSIKVMKWNER